MNKKRNKAEKTASKSLLEKAVEQTPDAAGCFKVGLKALGDDSGRLRVPKTRKIGGSLDIDNTTKRQYPNAARWDYAVEYDSEVFFIEVHDSNPDNVNEVIRKYEWLKGWLKEKAPSIKALEARSRPAYHWIATEKSTLGNSTTDYLRLAKHGIPPPTRYWYYKSLRTASHCQPSEACSRGDSGH